MADGVPLYAIYNTYEVTVSAVSVQDLTVEISYLGLRSKACAKYLARTIGSGVRSTSSLLRPDGTHTRKPGLRVVVDPFDPLF